MRDYISQILGEVVPLVDWWWLNQVSTFYTTSTYTLSGVTGAFTAGETITGGTSGSTATVDSYDSVNAPTLLYVRSLSAAFTATETITGGTSGVTATYASTAYTRSYQPVDALVTAWHSFVDQTNNIPLDIIGYDTYDGTDADRTESGDPRGVLIAGQSLVTGFPIVDVFPLPDTTVLIRSRFRRNIVDFTSSNDATDLTVLGVPKIIESVLIYGAAALYMEENGDDSGSARESGNFERTLTASKKQNAAMQGNRRYIPGSSTEGPILHIDSSIVIAS